MNRATLSGAQQALNDVMAQAPLLPEADRHALAAAVAVIVRLECSKVARPATSFQPLQRIQQAVALLCQRINDLRLKAKAYKQAYWAEFNYHCAKGYLTGQAPKVDEWTQRLESRMLQGREVGPLSVKLVNTVIDEDFDGSIDTHTEVICEGASKTWYRLVAWDRQIIDVVQLTPREAEEILRKVMDAEATVAAYEAISNTPATLHVSAI